MNTAFFSDLLASIADRGRSLLGRKDWSSDPAQASAGLGEACEALLSGRGEASGAAHNRLAVAVEAYRANPDVAGEAELHFAAEPRRQELFRRLNRTPGGTAALVQMRADLLALGRSDPKLAAVDRDFSHLLASWFNRGFLVLRRIDWSTPASILEKIIRYEAVHAMKDWNDLRRRIDPVDRRCYAFFHPALVDEPLIFVQVALTEAIPAAIAPLLAEGRETAKLDRARTAVFYSISNCQRGLDGISFGNFLIKQVVQELQRDLPKLETFVTLSPVPGFTRWLKSLEGSLSTEEADLVARLTAGAWVGDTAATEGLRKDVEALAGAYFLQAKGSNGRPLDPVARFHLGNGARLERINWPADLSQRGLRDGAGLMVNYLYDLGEIEENHEAYANQRAVMASGAVKRLARGTARPRLQVPAASSN